MNIAFKGLRYELTEEETGLAEQKIRTVSKYLDESKSEAQVFAELGRVTGAHHTGPIWQADINLEHHGKFFRASATADTLRTAIDEAVGELSRETGQAHERRKSVLRRGGAKVKAFFQGFGRV